MKRIFKYPLPVLDSKTLQLPAGSRILSVATQRDQVVLYALVNDSVTVMRSHTIIMRGTGQIADDVDECDFVGTVSLLGGDLMLHVFVRRTEDEKS